jgi:heme/copper-type cytochrome/quinol oxidase subunit 3
MSTPIDPTSPLPSGEGRGEGATSPGLAPANPTVPTSPDAQTAWFGAVVGLGAWAMFFAALAFSVGYLRLREPWPLGGAIPLPKLLPLASVLLLGAAGALLHMGARAARTTLFVLGSLASLVAALAAQGFVLSTLWDAGLKLPEGGAYASAVYGLGALHGLHVVAGLLGLARALVRTARGAQPRESLRVWSVYGNFLTVTGMILYAAVYLP